MAVHIDIIRYPHVAHCDVVVTDEICMTTIRVTTYVEALRLDALIRRLRTGKPTRAYAESDDVRRGLRKRSRRDGKRRKRAARKHERTNNDRADICSSQTFSPL